jgi:sterol desaturase/sphingolipid hydroxylase (fatty acid hydroxylase superfamily)
MSVSLVVFLAALLMMVYERSRPGRTWPQVCGWWSRALVVNALQAITIWLGGCTWDAWLGGHHCRWLADLDPNIGGLIGYATITFVFYWWHRWRHASHFLWRWFHQLHHSPQRLEILTAFYKHPFELVADSFLCSLILYPLLGLSAEAAVSATLLSGLAELFYHWNVQTPHWLGYLFQRPESHCVHHQDGVHAFNYSDLPLWDMLFGTFKNPKTFTGHCGLGQHEDRVWDMLCGRDVYRVKQSRSGSASQGPLQENRS